MNCPECGGKTEIIDTQKYDTVVWRRRRCESNHRFNTHETVIDIGQKARTKAPKQEQPKPPKSEPKPKVVLLPVRNTRKQIQDLREYLESRRENSDD